MLGVPGWTTHETVRDLQLNTLPPLPPSNVLALGVADTHRPVVAIPSLQPLHQGFVLGLGLRRLIVCSD